MKRKNKRDIKPIKKAKKRLKDIAKELKIPYVDKTPLQEKGAVKKASNLYLTFDLTKFNAERIAETIYFLSGIYKGIGGDELVITDMESFQKKGSKVPVLK